MSIHVLHVALALDVGGLERVVLDLVREGIRMGQRVSVLCLERRGSQAAEAEALGATVYSADKQPGLDWAVVPRVAALLAAARPDVIHSHHIGAMMYVARALGDSRPAVVHTEHNNHMVKVKGVAARIRRSLMLMMTARKVQRFNCVSSDVAQAISQRRLVPRSKLHVVANGVDLDRFNGLSGNAELRRSLGIPEDAVVFGTVGRLNEVKRQDILIEAFAKLVREFPGLYLLVVGDGPMMGTLQQMVQDLGLSASARLAGYQPQPQHYLASMDVFVLTSRIEGMPLVVLEAGGMGVPVVASNVGGLAEVSEGGRSLLLYEFGDDAALLAHLRRLASDAGFRAAMGRAGRERVEAAYSTRRVAADYQRQYLECLAEKGRAAAGAAR